jgi:RND family efflux transporter MFP subunit
MKLPNWRIWVGLLLIVAALLGSQAAVRRFTLPGHMSVLEAQGSDMTGMKPPVGAVPVAVVAVHRQAMEATVRYTGSAVPFTEQDIAARVGGTIVWMPAYPGMSVYAGQALARLDPRELRSKVDEQAAAVSMSQHATMIAGIQARQARSATAQARAQIDEATHEVAAAQSDLAAAQQEVTASEDERASAQADLESAQAGRSDAQSQLTAAQADQTYWSAQIRRSQALLTSGSISQQEFQQDRNQATAADAKVGQAEAHVRQAQAAIRGAQGRLKKADAMAASTQAKVVGAQAKIEGSQSKVRQMQANAGTMAAAADAAQHEIPHAQAGERQAAAQLATARVVAGYAEILATGDGVVTQRLVSPGALVQPGQPLFKIAQIRPIRLQANVAESDVPNIRLGSRVRVFSMKDPKHPLLARVAALFPATDPSARTSIVEAIVPNTDRRLLPGDFLTMDIATGESRNALTAPASALVSQPKATSPTLATEETQAVWIMAPGQPEKTIYTCTMHPEVRQDHPGDCPKCKMPLTPLAIGGKWRAHLAAVTIGLVNASSVEIKSGLKDGDQVIYAGFEGLHEGDPVVPTPWGTAGPLALPSAAGDAPTGPASVGTVYTCPMHPEVRQDHPGDCPKCGMHLIPAAPHAPLPATAPGASSTHPSVGPGVRLAARRSR